MRRNVIKLRNPVIPRPVRSLVPLHEGDVSEADRGSVPLYKGHSLSHLSVTAPSEREPRLVVGISGVRFSIGDRYTSVRYWLAMTLNLMALTAQGDPAKIIFKPYEI